MPLKSRAAFRCGCQRNVNSVAHWNVRTGILLRARTYYACAHTCDSHARKTPDAGYSNRTQTFAKVFLPDYESHFDKYHKRKSHYQPKRRLQIEIRLNGRMWRKATPNARRSWSTSLSAYSRIRDRPHRQRMSLFLMRVHYSCSRSYIIPRTSLHTAEKVCAVER